MNHKEIKEEAKNKIKGKLWIVLKPSLLVGLISFCVSMLLTIIFGNESYVASAIDSLCSLALLPMTFGVLVYELKFARGEEVDIKMIFDYYNKFLPIFAATLLIGLASGIGMIFLIIPGIIIALGLQMTLLIMADGEEDPIACIKKSWNMMNGYKWDYFVFSLSFIGWILLCVVTLGIATIWVAPYIKVSEMLYYDKLKQITK